MLLPGQVSESRSGVKQFNITGKNHKKFIDESRAPADVTAPVITLQSPSLSMDSLTTINSRTLMVKGKVKDAGGIYAVMVNGIEAQVSAEGQFLAEIPQAFGKNTVKIVATDIALNSSKLQFYSIRPTSTINASLAAKPAKPVNNYTIDITKPTSSSVVTVNNKLTLQACIKA